MAIETFLYSLKNFILLYQEKEEEKRIKKEEKLNTIKEKMLNTQGGLMNRGEVKSKLITELTEVVGILESKIKRMEITLTLKEEKIQGLTKKLQEKGITV